MRKDSDAKNAQILLEVAVRKGDPDAVVTALKNAWDENMTWQDELTSQDIARIVDALETFTDNAEVVRWSICALQAIVSEEVKDNTSRQYSVQSSLRVGPFKIYDNELGERILHKKLVTEVEEFEKAAAKMLAQVYTENRLDGYTISQDLIGFGLIRPDKLAKERGVWFVPFEIQMGLKKELAYAMKDHVLTTLADKEHLANIAKHDNLLEVLQPDESELERIQKELKKKARKKQEANAEDDEHGQFSEVPVSAIMVRKGGEEVIDPSCTVVDDPCTFKVAKEIDSVLVAMCSHPKNVDVQHCAAYLLRSIMAWGDADVARVMVEASMEDELQAAMDHHPNHRSLQTHGKFAIRRLRELVAAGVS